MKAKDLIPLLQQNPEMDVVIPVEGIMMDISTVTVEEVAFDFESEIMKYNYTPCVDIEGNQLPIIKVIVIR